jgi:PAS domain S-box-containing protein
VRRTAIRETLLFWRSHEEPGRAGEASETDVGVLRALASVVFEGVAVVEEGGRISEANEVFASLFGYELPEVVGRTLEEFVIPEFRGLVEKSLSVGFGETYEVVALKRDGTPLNVEIRSRPSSYGGRVVHLVAVRDISGEIGVEGRLSQTGYRALVEQIPAVTYTQEAKAGHHFASLYLSPQAERILGYTLEEFASDPGLWVRLIHPDDRERVLAEDARTDETGEQFSAEYRLLTRDGSMVWVRDEATLVSDEDGRPLCWQGVLTDVTDRKQAEEALKESERRYADLLSSTRAFVYRCLNEPGWPNEFASAYALELTGYAPEKLLVGGKMRFSDLIVEEDSQRVWDEVQTALQKRERFKIRYAIRRRDGSIRHVEQYGQGVYDQEDNVEAIEGIVYDVTELKRAETRLREAEERYRTLVEEIPAVTYIKAVDESSQSSYVSPQIEDMLGYKPEEWTSDPDQWIKIMHPADRERVLAEVARTDETGDPFRMEFRQFARDGRVVWVRDEAVLVRDEEGNPSYWLGFQYDITKRKRSEEAREESELRLRTVISNVPVVLFAIDFAGVMSLSEGKGMGALGLEPGEVVGRSISEVFGGVPGILEDVDRTLAGETLSTVREVNSRTFEMWYSPVRANTGEVTGVTGVSIDITDRKRAEEELKESAGRFRSTFENAPIGMALVSLDNHYRQVNQAFCDMLGYSQEELLSWRTFDITHPDDLEASIARTQALLEGAVERDLLEKRYIRSDGEIVWALSSVSLVRDSRGDPAYFVSQYQNITERKKAEEDMKEANRRLEELAVLKADFTAMVAHELDTPLAVIRGYADMLATGDLDLDEQARALDRVQAETDLLEALVSDVRSAAAVEREDFTIELQQVAVGGLLRDAAAFVETLHGDHQLVTHGATDGWVLADPRRIRQVLRNLLSNAAKYSPDGTPIELRTAPGATPGRVRIEVADRGPGVHPDDATRIFEKFGRGRDGGGRKVAGTGLGLYLSKRILQAHGSGLTLDSEPGGGSVFGFELRAGR